MQPTLTAEELAKALNLPSKHTVRVLVRQRKIPVIKIGYRTYRFDLEMVREALLRLSVQSN